MFRKLMVAAAAAGIAFAFPAAAIATGSGPNSAPRAAAATTVDATEDASNNYVFTPKTITISTGQTVTFDNNDPGQAAHTATADDGSWDSGNLGAGQTFTTPPFATAGTFTYKCTYHATLGMVGTIIVTGGPGGGAATTTTLASPTPTISPSFYGNGLPSPQAAPTPVPSQKYFPKIGGAVGLLGLVGIGTGYLKFRRKVGDKS